MIRETAETFGIITEDNRFKEKSNPLMNDSETKLIIFYATKSKDIIQNHKAWQYSPGVQNHKLFRGIHVLHRVKLPIFFPIHYTPIAAPSNSACNHPAHNNGPLVIVPAAPAFLSSSVSSPASLGKCHRPHIHCSIIVIAVMAANDPTNPATSPVTGAHELAEP
nr:hypothetical protein Iba_chr09bCG2350 [Ipomoea batatas]GMD33277.1 hypothetical protein Iba_chr09cCG1100 [Ipomoea batatas]GMD34945.1 hypothetical protein Iba_chr09dCG2280 [Ipomoea batatas]GME13961.1 hypothetical protein Iba_scaffold14893CG0010 [Ipomoea batatas]